MKTYWRFIGVQIERKVRRSKRERDDNEFFRVKKEICQGECRTDRKRETAFILNSTGYLDFKTKTIDVLFIRLFSEQLSRERDVWSI